MDYLVGYLIENPIYISILIFLIAAVLIIQSDIGKDKLEENETKIESQKKTGLSN